MFKIESILRTEKRDEPPNAPCPKKKKTQTEQAIPTLNQRMNPPCVCITRISVKLELSPPLSAQVSLLEETLRAERAENARLRLAAATHLSSTWHGFDDEGGGPRGGSLRRKSMGNYGRGQVKNGNLLGNIFRMGDRVAQSHGVFFYMRVYQFSSSGLRT